MPIGLKELIRGGLISIAVAAGFFAAFVTEALRLPRMAKSGSLLIWAAAFLNHTAVRPYFMARLLLIPVIGATVVIAARLLGSERTAAHHANVASSSSWC